MENAILAYDCLSIIKENIEKKEAKSKFIDDDLFALIDKLNIHKTQ